MWKAVQEHRFKTHISPAKWTVMKTPSRELLRFSSNAKSQSVKKSHPRDRSAIHLWLHVMFPQFTSSQNAYFSPVLPRLGSAQLMKSKLSLLPAIHSGQITRCGFWSWHVCWWWWCRNWWPTASFSLSWEGPAGRRGNEKTFDFD